MQGLEEDYDSLYRDVFFYCACKIPDFYPQIYIFF